MGEDQVVPNVIEQRKRMNGVKDCCKGHLLRLRGAPWKVCGWRSRACSFEPSLSRYR